MILTDIVAMILRLAELVFAAIVAGITGAYLHDTQNVSSWDNGRWIYTEVVAGLSIFLSIIWLFPFASSFIHYPVDFVISICWWVAFGLLVNLIGNNCGYVFNWGNIAVHGDDQCAKFKADIAFCFLSALCWLVSALLGAYWTHRHTATRDVPAHRRRWYRSRV